MAKDKVLMGVERKSLILSDEERKIPRTMKRGHGWCGYDSGRDPVHKAYDYSAWYGIGLDDAVADGRQALLHQGTLGGMLAVLMGGRTAEEMFLGHSPPVPQ